MTKLFQADRTPSSARVCTIKIILFVLPAKTIDRKNIFAQRRVPWRFKDYGKIVCRANVVIQRQSLPGIRMTAVGHNGRAAASSLVHFRGEKRKRETSEEHNVRNGEKEKERRGEAREESGRGTGRWWRGDGGASRREGCGREREVS